MRKLRPWEKEWVAKDPNTSKWRDELWPWLSNSKVKMFIFIWVSSFCSQKKTTLLEKWRTHYCILVLPCSVQFSHSVVSDSLRPHESQHTRPPWPGLPVHHQLPEFIQTHVHWGRDAIQLLILCCPLLLLPLIPLSIREGWVNSSHQVAKVLEFQLQHQSFQWTPRTNLL